MAKIYCTMPGGTCSECLAAVNGRDCRNVSIRYNLWETLDDGAASLIGSSITRQEADRIKEQKAQDFISEDRLILTEI